MTMPARERTVCVVNPQGLHARPAHLLVTAANRFQARVEVVRNGEVADGRSILSLLTLAAEPGAELILRAEGEDADAALAALAALFVSGFGELEDQSAEGPSGATGSS